MIGDNVFSALTSLVEGRVYPSTAPDDVVKPYMVYTRIASKATNQLDGTVLLDQTRLQVDIYADKETGGYDITQSLAASVKAAIHADFRASTLELEQDLYYADVKLYCTILDFSIQGAY